MSMYAFRSVEEKWQQRWDEARVNEIPENQKIDGAKKCYVLEMFPYPSGKFHMGHVRNYCIGDVLARFKRAQGYQVLHPFGWDAFGMPAENAAMQNHSHPKTWTYQNIAAMKTALGPLGFSYDWPREFATCDEGYYGREQQLFLEMYERGLIYRKESWVNWDPVDQTVLANEQVIDGKGWRSGAQVIKKQLQHWCVRITKYADTLLGDLATMGADDTKKGWPEKVLTMQRNWIGKSEGALVPFDLVEPVEGEAPAILVFTTRPETLFGAQFCAIAATHPLAMRLAQTDAALAAFIEECQKTAVTESALNTAEKKGYRTHLFVRNPLNEGQTVPVFVANFVVMEYGTGAVFGCPAHDERDYEFAQLCGLSVLPVICPPHKDVEDVKAGRVALPYTEPCGMMFDSGPLNGLSVMEARSKACDLLEQTGKGERKTTYRLRDWTVSRQRYWGCPIPMIHCSKCGTVPVRKEDLPVLLPDDVEFDRPGNPLDRHPTWKHTTCPRCGQPAERETDTLDTFFESSWYFLRYCCPHAKAPLDCALVDQWMPVDLYIGGIEHAVLHLLYARFFTMVLHDLGYTTVQEPFASLLTQGMVCHTSFKDEDGAWLYPSDVEKGVDGKYVTVNGKRPVTAVRSEKMSKSKKNVVDPTKMVETYGADAVRIFIMSDTPYEKDFDWNTEALEGVWRYLNKTWRLCERVAESFVLDETLLKKAQDAEIAAETVGPLLKTTHQYLKRITQALEDCAFHKAIALHRELTREIEGALENPASISSEGMAEVMATHLSVLFPFAPHFALEGYHTLFRPSEVRLALPWPRLRSDLAVQETVTVAVQVNGKLRGTFEALSDASEETLRSAAFALEGVKKFTDGLTIKKVIFVKNKLVNIVV